GLVLLSQWLLSDSIPLLVRGSITMPLSLIVVSWPVLRGIPWRQVRQDIGWTAGRNPLLEPFAGLTCYIVNLPLVVAGFVTTLILLAVSTGLAGQAGEAGAGGEAPTPSHPIVPEIAGADWPGLILIFFLLSVVAPV